MSAKEMCSVPTLNGDVEVPVGTAILLDGFLRFADKCGFQTDRNDVGDGNPFPYGDCIVTIVAVPDGEGGWITPGATPEPKWVALTEEQVALLPDRTPVRVEWDGTAAEGLFRREKVNDGHIHLHRSTGGRRRVGYLADATVTVHVHPEDVPDADLIERAAREIEKVISTSARWSDYQQAGRAVLAVVRGEQA